MDIRLCTIEDVPLRADLNKLFFEEEQKGIDLHLPHLQERMKGYITSGHKAFLFREVERIVGYALWDISSSHVNLRQFFISREERRKGYGKRAFQLMVDQLDIRDAEIEVYYWDDSGSAFWESLGLNTQRNRIITKK